MDCPYCGHEVIVSIYIICAYCHLAWDGLEFAIAKDAEVIKEG